MTTQSKIITVATLIVSNVFVDQITKIIAKHSLEPNTIYLYFFDLVRLMYAENSGVAYSLGSDLPESIRFFIFNIFVSVVMLFMLGYVLYFIRELTMSRLIGLGLIISGGIGNLIDRYFRDGAVIDFLNIGTGSIHTAIFNWADVCVTTGIILILFFGLSEIFTKPNNYHHNVNEGES